jgi:hypothetical protein
MRQEIKATLRVSDSRDNDVIFNFTSLEQARDLVKRELRVSSGYVQGLRTIRECADEISNSGKWFYPEFQSLVRERE